MDRLTIVIPFYNGHEYVTKLLLSIPQSIDVILVDDLSDTPLEISDTTPNCRVHRLPEKGYFSGAVNKGIELAGPGRDILILNQDTHLDGTAALDLLAQNRDTYGLIGEKIQANHPAFPLGYIHGTFMFIRADVIEKVGLLNALSYPLWGSTSQYQLRAARRNFKVLMLDSIPGFTHHREADQNFGSSIKSLLQAKPELRAELLRTPPEVSVIATSYNYGRYLPDLVASLIGGNTSLGPHPGQTLQSFELILVNDGSQDETHEVAQSLADPLKGIRYIYQENGGTASAHNTGIRASYGKYITCISGDDMMEPHNLETLYKASIANPRSLVFTDMIEFAQGRRRNPWPTHGPTDLESLLQKNSFPVGSMYPRDAWQSVGGYPELMRYGREDWAFNVACAAKGYCGIRVSPAGYLYRREGQNRTARTNTEQWQYRFIAQMHQLFPDLYEGERPMGCCGNRSALSGLARSGNLNMKSGMPSGPGPDRAVRGVYGAHGMVEVEFQGDDPATKSWTGFHTHVRYTFSASKRRRYVDSRDLTSGQPRNPGILEYKLENGSPAFIEPGGEPVVDLADSTLANPVVGNRETLIPAHTGTGQLRIVEFTSGVAAPIKEAEETTVETPVTQNSVVSMTISEIKEKIDDADLVTLRAWLDEELNSDKPRKTVVTLLTKAQSEKVSEKA